MRWVGRRRGVGEAWRWAAGVAGGLGFGGGGLGWFCVVRLGGSVWLVLWVYRGVWWWACGLVWVCGVACVGVWWVCCGRWFWGACSCSVLLFGW